MEDLGFEVANEKQPQDIKKLSQEEVTFFTELHNLKVQESYDKGLTIGLTVGLACGFILTAIIVAIL